jgi:transposase
MPTQRRPLGEISRNISKRKELSPYIRAQIIGASKCGVNPTQISKQLSIPRSTVQSTLDRDELRNNHTSLPRSGRPRLSSKQDERLLLRVVRQFPKYTYKQLRAFTGLKISTFTIRRILRRHHITTWRAKRRPNLTKDVAKNRYNWCQPRRHWSVDK